MSHWWRAYDGAVDHPKLLLLSDRQHRAWFNLMCVASDNGGILPETKIVALKLRVSDAKARAIIAQLCQAKLFDDDGAGNVSPHNWGARQFKTDEKDPTNAERQKRYRDRHAVTENAVTHTVTAKLPETETEKKDAASAAPDPSNLERELFDRGKVVLGRTAGGLIASLLKAKAGNTALARAAIEQASTKQNPREYIGAVIKGGQASPDGKRLTNDEAYYGTGRIPGII